MKKIYLMLLLLLMPIVSLRAVDSEDVNYSVDQIYINSEIEIAGGVRFKEVIKISGTYNGYIRDLTYKNDNLNEFDKTTDSFYGSDIYNGTGINIRKVGILDIEELDTNEFSDEYITDNLELFESESDKTYEVTDIDNGKSVKMYNETISGSTYFYIEYFVSDVIVEHTDVAEFYYNIIGDNFADTIKEIIAILYLPYPDENLKVWAHGPLNGEAFIIEGGYGAMLKIENLSAYTPIDLRMTYNKEQLMINLNEKKKSGIEGLPLILKVEEERAQDANKQREVARNTIIFIKIANILYLVGLMGVFIFVYRKYDKEYKSSFTNKYNREFIEDYDVEVVEYLMNKSIGTNAFSASILNLIYKKKIKVEKIEGKKDDYLFTLINEKNTSESEKEIIDLLFNKIGTNSKVKMSEIKKASKNEKEANEIYSSYNSWKSIINEESHKQGFFENQFKIKLLFGLYALLGFFIGYLGIGAMIKGLPIAVILLSIIFLVYILCFTKRSKKGNEHYIKWKAFKKFLEDFGRFEEKDLPEIILWERYLVYATIFGIADKVSKIMKVKFEQMNMNDKTFNNSLFNYYLLNNINSDLSKNISSSIKNSISTVEIAKSTNSSGSGFGGGFSSGGGFGGGGGGGRGF